MLTNVQSRAVDQRLPDEHRRFSASNCVTCEGRKTFTYFAPGTSEPATWQCSCRDQYRLFRWFSYSGIGLKYQRFGWRDVDSLDQTAGAALFDYIEHLDAYRRAGFGLTLTGPRGTGKTMLANLILKEACARGVTVYSTSFSQMIEEFTGGWGDRAQSRWFNQRIRDAGLLFIDDLGRERNKGEGSVGENMLETVIRHRISSQLPTIITTNIEANQIGVAYGGHTASLLTECSIEVVVPGDDSRQNIGARDRRHLRQGIRRPVIVGEA